MCEKKIKKSLFGFLLIPLIIASSLAATLPTGRAYAALPAGGATCATGTTIYYRTGNNVSSEQYGKNADGTECKIAGPTFMPSGVGNTYSSTGATGTCGTTLTFTGAPTGATTPASVITQTPNAATGACTGGPATTVAVAQTEAAAVKDAQTTAAAGDTTNPPTSCAIDGVGWLVCNVANFLSQITDGLYGYISDTFLSVDSGLVSNDSQTHVAWSGLLGVANIIFVIIFLIIIFAQATGVGISNYGIKKMLPKIIIGVILINLSYYICQAAVDISNIIGYGLPNLFKGITPQNTTVGTSWVTVISTVLAAGFAAGAVAVAALGFGLSFLLICLLTVIFIAIVLIIQKVLIVICVIFSPIAFAAWLLPNTEKIFKTWWKVFYAMLIVFPLVSLVVAGSALASEVIVKSMSSASVNAGANQAGAGG